MKDLRKKAPTICASKLYIGGQTDKIVNEMVISTVQAGAKNEEYMMDTVLARPIIGKRLAEITIKEGADAICHRNRFLCVE